MQNLSVSSYKKVSKKENREKIEDILKQKGAVINKIYKNIDLIWNGSEDIKDEFSFFDYTYNKNRSLLAEYESEDFFEYYFINLESYEKYEIKDILQIIRVYIILKDAEGMDLDISNDGIWMEDIDRIIDFDYAEKFEKNFDIKNMCEFVYNKLKLRNPNEISKENIKDSLEKKLIFNMADVELGKDPSDREIEVFLDKYLEDKTNYEYYKTILKVKKRSRK